MMVKDVDHLMFGVPLPIIYRSQSYTAQLAIGIQASRFIHDVITGVSLYFAGLRTDHYIFV